jgi:hypothetical protein
MIRGLFSWKSFEKVKDQKFQQLRRKFSNVPGFHEEVTLSTSKGFPVHAMKVCGEVVV